MPRELNFDEDAHERAERDGDVCLVAKVGWHRPVGYLTPLVEGTCGDAAVAELADGTPVCDRHAREALDEGEELS